MALEHIRCHCHCQNHAMTRVLYLIFVGMLVLCSHIASSAHAKLDIDEYTPTSTSFSLNISMPANFTTIEGHKWAIDRPAGMIGVIGVTIEVEADESPIVIGGNSPAAEHDPIIVIRHAEFRNSDRVSRPCDAKERFAIFTEENTPLAIPAPYVYLLDEKDSIELSYSLVRALHRHTDTSASTVDTSSHDLPVTLVYTFTWFSLQKDAAGSYRVADPDVVSTPLMLPATPVIYDIMGCSPNSMYIVEGTDELQINHATFTSPADSAIVLATGFIKSTGGLWISLETSTALVCNSTAVYTSGLISNMGVCKLNFSVSTNETLTLKAGYRFAKTVKVSSMMMTYHYYATESSSDPIAPPPHHKRSPWGKIFVGVMIGTFLLGAIAASIVLARYRKPTLNDWQMLSDGEADKFMDMSLPGGGISTGDADSGPYFDQELRQIHFGEVEEDDEEEEDQEDDYDANGAIPVDQQHGHHFHHHHHQQQQQPQQQQPQQPDYSTLQVTHHTAEHHYQPGDQEELRFDEVSLSVDDQEEDEPPTPLLLTTPTIQAEAAFLIDGDDDGAWFDEEDEPAAEIVDTTAPVPEAETNNDAADAASTLLLDDVDDDEEYDEL